MNYGYLQKNHIDNIYFSLLIYKCEVFIAIQISY